MTDLLPLERQATDAAGQLPALLAEARQQASTIAAGLHGRRRAGTGETFWQYRDYVAGDPVSSIDWRQSARSPQRLFVRETEWETAATIRFWCQGGDSFDYASSDNVPAKRWRAQVLCTALALLAVRAGERVGHVSGDALAYSGHSAVMSLAEVILAATANDDLPPSPPPGTTHAVYVSDFHLPTEALVAQLKAIAETGTPLHLIQISDPAEVEFPFKGRTRFESPGSPQRYQMISSARDIRADYMKRRDAHRHAIANIGAAFGATVLSHSTDQPPARVLSALHAAIAGDTR